MNASTSAEPRTVLYPPRKGEATYLMATPDGGMALYGARGQLLALDSLGGVLSWWAVREGAQAPELRW